MDKASDFESEDCGFESRRGQFSYFINAFTKIIISIMVLIKWVPIGLHFTLLYVAVSINTYI